MAAQRLGTLGEQHRRLRTSVDDGDQHRRIPQRLIALQARVPGIEAMVAVLVRMDDEILFPRRARSEISSRKQWKNRLIHQALNSASRSAGMIG